MRALVVILVVILAGCTKAPPIPELAQPRPTSVETLALGSELNPAAIRAIFRTLNESDRLKDLAPYFEKATDEELVVLADLINRYGIQDREAEAILTERIADRGFTRLRKKIAEFERLESFPTFLSGLRNLIWYERFPEWMERDGLFLHPAWVQNWESFQVPLAGYWNDLAQKKISTISPTPLLWTRDLKKLAQDSALVNEMQRLADLHLAIDLVPIFQPALRLLSDSGKKPEPFVALTMGARSHLFAKSEALGTLREYRNEFDRLLKFVEITNRPSSGLFGVLRDRLREKREFGKPFAETYHQWVLGKVVGQVADLVDLSVVREASREPAEKDGAKFNQAYHQVLNAVTRITGPFLDENEPASFYHNSGIQINAYVLTYWLRDIARSPLAVEWTKEAVIPEVALDFVVENADGTLKFPLEEKITEPSLKTMYAELKKTLTDKPGQAAYYQFSLNAYPDPVVLRDAFKEALLQTDAYLALLSTDASYFALQDELTGENSVLPFSLEALDRSQSLFDSLTWAIISMPPENYERLSVLLFEKLNFGNLTPNQKQAVLRILEKPEHEALKNRVIGMMDSVGALANLSKVPAKGYPSLYEIFYGIMRFTGKEETRWMSDTLTLLSHSRIAAQNEEAPLYPAFYSFLSGGMPGQILYYLAQGDEAFWKITRQTLQQVLSQEGVPFHAKEFLRLPEERWQAVIDVWNRGLGDWLFSFDSLSARERLFAVRLVQRGDAKKLWSWLDRNHQKGDFIAGLLKLHSSGELVKAAKLLRLVNQERVRALADLIVRLSESGELQPLLESLQFAI